MGPVEAGADGEEVRGGLQAGLGPDAGWGGGGLGWESHQVATDGVGHGEGAPDPKDTFLPAGAPKRAIWV